MDKIIEHNVNDIVDTILNDYTHDRSIDKMNCSPSRTAL